MSSTIRIRRDTRWGSCFCWRVDERLRFASASHVLKDCGIGAGATGGAALMCDDRTPERLATLANFFWDDCCDYVEFDCDFPGDPFPINRSPVASGVPVRLDGYLIMPNDTMPQCGIVNDRITGNALGTHPCEGGAHHWITLSLRTPQPHLPGMSGGPVLITNGSPAAPAIGLFSSRLKPERGGHYVMVKL